MLETPKSGPSERKATSSSTKGVNGAAKGLEIGERSVINLSSEWQKESQTSKIKYFIPEWDDLVDPAYDFLNDIHSGGKGSWHNQVYAHEMYENPNYDGILISRVVVDGNKRRRELMETLGVHGSLRVPQNFKVMGDCGAFGYLNEEVPPYSTQDVLDYYT
ncbi:MAG: hypothetical protein EOP17_07060, partial [Rhizobiaceae bacterium]